MYRILLIDDDATLVADMLTMFGYTVDVAPDGYSGIQMLQKTEKPFDLVILDVQMPRMDGWSTLRTIREGQTDANIPIIMLTSSDSEESVVHGLRRGADEYLAKPIAPRRLLAHIEALVRRTRWDHEMDPHASVADAARSESIDLLTQRETQVLKCIAQGFPNQQIAEQLTISEVTVKNHLANIYRKLNVSNRTEAAFIAHKLKLV